MSHPKSFPDHFFSSLLGNYSHFALHNCSLLSKIHISLLSYSFFPKSSSKSLSYFIGISPFSSVGSIFTSSTSQKFSALSLAVGPFWVSGCDVTGVIYPACITHCILRVCSWIHWPVRSEMGNRERSFPCAPGTEGCENSVSSGNERIFMKRKCAWFSFSDRKWMKHLKGSTPWVDIRKIREVLPAFAF